MFICLCMYAAYIHLWRYPHMYVVICAHVCVCMWSPKVNPGYLLRLFNILHIEAGSFVVPRAGCLACTASQHVCRLAGSTSSLDWDYRWPTMPTDALHGFWGAKLNNRHVSYRAMPRVPKVFLWITKSNKMIHKILRDPTGSGTFYIKEIYLWSTHSQL